MTLQISGKLELNVLDAMSKPEYISNFAIRNHIPAIVVSADYVAPFAANRAVHRGQYKIICALDFPKGGEFALDKIYRANPDLIGADGFDILLSSTRTEIEVGNEMKALHSFLRMNRPMCEIRWCLKMHTNPDDAIKALKHVSNYSPTFVRLDPHLEIPNVSLEDHKKAIEHVRKHVPFNLKIGGNVDLELIKELQSLPNVKRFDVTLKQAEKILKDSVVSVAPLVKKDSIPAVKKGNHSRIRI